MLPGLSTHSNIQIQLKLASLQILKQISRYSREEEHLKKVTFQAVALFYRSYVPCMYNLLNLYCTIYIFHVSDYHNKAVCNI